LFDFVDSLPPKPDGLPRHRKRQAGDENRRLNCDDILKLLSALDAAQVTLPTFVSVDLSGVPPINPGDVDVCSLAMNVENLHKQMIQWRPDCSPLKTTPELLLSWPTLRPLR